MSPIRILAVALAVSRASGARESRGSDAGGADVQLDCEPYVPPAGSGVQVLQAGGTPGMAGSTVEFKPATDPKHQRVFGSKTAVCGADGKYTLSGLPPVSAAVCKSLGIDDDYLSYYSLKVRAESLVDPPFDTSLYKDEIKALQPSQPERTHVLQGTVFDLGCTAEGAVLVGGGRVACKSNGKLADGNVTNSKCAVAAKLKVTAVRTGRMIPSAEVEYFKIKLFSGSKDKYDSEIKVKPDQLGSDAAAIVAKGPLEDTFLQVTVCAEKGVKDGMFSKCKVGAVTLEPASCPECNIARLLREASPERISDTPYDPEAKKVDRMFRPNFAFKPAIGLLPVEFRGGYFSASPKITVSISFVHIDVD